MDATNTVIDPMFGPAEADRLAAYHLVRLAAGTLATVRVPGFLPAEVCRDVAAVLDSVPMDICDPRRVNPPIARLGPVLNDHRRDGALNASYWPQVDLARQTWRDTGLAPDPLRLCLDAFGVAWGGDIVSATIGGRAAFAGTIREINGGAHVHYDEVVREFPDGLFDQAVVAQLAFNAYLSVPASGGQTTIWRRCWQPADETARLGYGYRPEVVAGVQSVTVTPATGDGLIFNPRHYHAVAPSVAGRRITLGFFLAITATGQLIVWS